MGVGTLRVGVGVGVGVGRCGRGRGRGRGWGALSELALSLSLKPLTVHTAFIIFTYRNRQLSFNKEMLRWLNPPKEYEILVFS